MTSHLHGVMSVGTVPQIDGRWRFVLWAALGMLGCGRVAHDGVGSDGRGGGGGDDGALVDGGSVDGGAPDGGPGPGSTDAGRDAVVDPSSCPSPGAPAAPLRRLTRFEYENTVRDLLGTFGRSAEVLPPDSFSNDADEMGVSNFFIEGYHTLAHELALEVTQNALPTAPWIGCDVTAMGEDACRGTFIRNFAARAFRRPVQPDDVAELERVFATGRQLGAANFMSGVRAVAEVVLQAPEFLYRVELGEPADISAPGLDRPSPHEMAARLSYLLWGSTPDDALLDAANQGKLRTRQEIAAQAERLLGDRRAHDVVRHFYFQLLHLGELSDRELHLNPTFTPELPELFRRETEHFVDDVIWQGPGTFEALLTAPFTWTNGPLAGFYGVGGVTGDAFRRVDLDATRRSGLLTQGKFLASNSTGNSTHPTLRGKTIFEQILCREIPPPPEVSPPPPVSPPGGTTRERLQQFVSDPRCQSCHRSLDPIGYAFEHYDAVGAWRDQENGRPIDATGEIYETDAIGKFDGAIELVGRLAQSHDAAKCHVGKWLAFAYGRKEAPEDACSRRQLEDEFDRTNGNVRRLLVALTQTDGFLYRPRR